VTRLPFFLLGVAVVLLVAAVGVWRLERFLASESLRPAVPGPGERAPLDGCTNGRLDRSRPRAWSLMDEAEVYSTIIRTELLPRPTRDLTPQTLPDRILVHPHLADARPWGGDGRRWSMTFACEQLPRLLVATAASFRMANRRDGEGIFRFISVPVPVAYALPTRKALLALEGTPGYLRFSRAGFSDDAKQALVYLERTVAYGFTEGTFYLLQRQDGAWRVVERQVAWMT
jgi:hypothetical protein